MDFRIVAYDIFGAKRGPVPATVSTTVDLDLEELSILAIEMLRDAPRSNILEAGNDVVPEFRLQYRQGKGQNWLDPLNASFVYTGGGRDEQQAERTRPITAAGFAWFFTQTPGWDPMDENGDPPDPALGEADPVVKFAAGTLWPVILRHFFDEAQAKGWCPAFTRDFNNVNDSAALPWEPSTAIPGPLEIRCDAPFDAILELAVRAKAVETAFDGYLWKAWNYGTHLRRDLTIEGVGGAAVVLRNATAGITTAPEKEDFTNIVAGVRVFGDKGRFWDFTNPDVVPALGTPTFRRIPAAGVTEEDVAQMWADAVFAAGSFPLRQFKRTVNLDNATVLPFIHFRPGDKVEYTIGPESTNPLDKQKREKDRVQHIRITLTGNTQTADYTFRDRIPSPDARQAKSSRRASRGTARQMGEARKAGTDPRIPDAPTGLTVTPSIELDKFGKSVARFVLTCVDPATTIDTPEGVVEPIINAQVLWEFRKTGNDDDWQERRTKTNQLRLALRKLDTDQEYRFRARLRSRTGVYSEYCTEVTATATGDDDELVSAGLVFDPVYGSSLARAARAADAGAGFAFITESGRSVAEWTTTGAVLDMGISRQELDGTKRREGRRRVSAGEKYRVLIEQKKVGTTATGRARIRFTPADGTAATTTTIFSTAATNTYAEVEGEWIAPSDGKAEVWVVPSALSAATLRVRRVGLDRKASTPRIEDLAVITAKLGDQAATGDKIFFTDPLDTRHTATGPLLRASASAAGFKASPAGLYFYDAAGLAFEATSGGVFIRGSLEAGDILFADDVIDFGGLHSIAYTGSDLVFTAASGFIFDGASSFLSTVNVAAGFTADNIVSDGDLQAGGEFACNGNATSGKILINQALSDTLRITKLEDIALAFGFGTL